MSALRRRRGLAPVRVEKALLLEKGADPEVVSATREGFPVLDGVPTFLRGVRHLLDYRDFQARDPAVPPRPSEQALATWRKRLGEGALDEHDAMSLLRDFDLPANAGRIAESEAGLRVAVRDFGFPLALKTAVRGIAHKSDRDGVRLNIGDETALALAYKDLATRIGPRVLVAPMVAAQGVEMLLGMIHDEQFGPVVVLGFGGLHVEALADVVYALPPFDAAEARRLLERLHLAPLLVSRRHRRALAVDSFCETAARFSSLVASLSDLLSEIDLNPVILHADGCIIVDALVVPTNPRKH